MDDNICLHAINSSYEYNYRKINLIKLEFILKDNALLSRRLQGLNFSTGFNGMDYISLCDYQKRNIYPINYPQYTSYDAYIKESLSIAFPKDKLPLITPFIIDVISQNKKGYNQMANLGVSHKIRYSDLYDEVQVKDRISLDLMCAITIPINELNNIFLSKDRNTQNITKYLNTIRTLLIKYDHLVPIYDIDSMTELKDEETIKKLLKKKI